MKNDITSLLKPADREACMRTLQALCADPEASDQEIERGVASLYKKVRRLRRKESAIVRKNRDRESVARTGSMRTRAAVVSTQPEDLSPKDLVARSRLCYICREKYRELHAWYHQLCSECGDLNFSKRNQRADLRGYRALVTGARIKIGFATALTLLRQGAEVHATTRFAEDARARYAAEPDFADWRDRLCLWPVDLEDLNDAKTFVERIDATVPSLEILINNAAQTVRLPDAHREALASADQAIELEDTRESNGWTARAEDVMVEDLLQVLKINACVPFLLTSRLAGSMRRSPQPSRFVINVTGRDGRFGVGFKSDEHPHVNMSKAALNMLTRTSAQEFALSHIYMCSVDVGWITVEGSHTKRERTKRDGFVTPLDEWDGAARICDPILQGLAGNPVHGQLLRHFHPAAW